MTALSWVVGFLLIWAPGAAIDAWLELRVTRDRLVRLALQMGLGLAFWPLVFLWSSTLGIRLSTGMTRILFGGALALAVGVPLYRSIRTGRSLSSFRRPSVYLLCFLFLVALTLATRMAQIRELVLPAWVDPVHHTMITRLLLEHGTIPETYSPFIEEGRFYYHWGYHSLLASLAWMLGKTDAWTVTDLMLHFGQFLNTLIVLVMYAAGRVMFSSRAAGLLTALLASLVSFFPAYYVSWGRYTHLTGVLVLVPFGIILWQVLRNRSARYLIALSVVGAGLVLIHVRVAFFALTFSIALGALSASRKELKPLLRWATAGVVIVLLTGPWLLRLAQTREVHYVVVPSVAESTGANWEQAREIQWNVVWSPNNRFLFMLASAGLATLATWETTPVWLKIAAITWWVSLIGIAEWYWRHRRKRSRRRPRLSLEPWTPLMLLALWCLVTLVLLNFDRLGLPRVGFATNHSAVITLFLPLSLGAGGLAGWVLDSMIRFRFRKVVIVLVVAGGALAAVPSMIDIINPVTILARSDDLAAIRWIDRNLPEDAAFVIPVQPWQGGAWIGTDGGYWISVLTERQTILPPALYAWSIGNDRSHQRRQLLEEFVSASELDDALVHRLLGAGFTHLYLGVNSRALAEDLRNNPNLSLVHEEGQARILALR